VIAKQSREGWFPSGYFQITALEPPRFAFGSASPPESGGEFQQLV